VGAARILARRGRFGDRATHEHEALEVQPVVPRQIEAKIGSVDSRPIEPLVEFDQAIARARQSARVAQDAHVRPHQVPQGLANLLEVALRLAEGMPAGGHRRFERTTVRFARVLRTPDPGAHRFARHSAEHRGVRDTVSAQAVRAMHPAGILARDEKTRHRSRAISRKLDPAHEVMRGGHDLDQAAGKIETAVAAPLDHATKRAPHVLRSQVRHADVDASVRRGVAGAHLVEDGPRDDVAGRALQQRIVALHESLARAVQEMSACATQSLLEYGAGHPRVRPREQASGVKLHHLHVAERQPRGERHREAIATLVARRRVIPVHRRPAARGEQNCFRPHQHEFAVPHVDHEHPGDSGSAMRRDQRHGPVFLETVDASRPDLLGQPVDDLDTGEIALVHRAVERLAGERLLVDGAVRTAVEKASELVLELPHPLDRQRDELPGELLVREPRTAFDGVHEMPLDRVAGRDRDVVAALDHAGATAFSEQPLYCNRDVPLGGALMGVERGKESRAARAENQDVSRDAAHVRSVRRGWPALRRERGGRRRRHRSRGSRHAHPSRPATARIRAPGNATAIRD
jgi:hypothetical protein